MRTATELPMPAHGPSSRLSPRVLLSRIEELSAASPDSSKRCASRSGASSLVIGKGTEKLRQSAKKGGPMLSVTYSSKGSPLVPRIQLAASLYELDHSQAPSDGLLSVQHSVDESGASDFLGETASTFSFPSKPSTDRYHLSVPGCSLNGGVSSASGGNAMGKSPRLVASPLSPAEATAAALQANPLREEHLYHSFRHGLEEVEARIKRLEQFIQLSRRSVRDLVCESPNVRQFPEVTKVLDKLDRSMLGVVPPKPPNEHPIRDVSMLDPSEKSCREEVAMAGEVLNFCRWLCGLRPLRTLDVCVKSCEAVTDAILPRNALVHMSLDAHLQEFAGIFGDFVRGTGPDQSGSRVIVLHRESSLVAAVEGSLVACRARGVRGWPCQGEAVKKIAARSDEPTPLDEAKELLVKMVRTSGMEIDMPLVNRVDYNDLPKWLQPLRVLWDLHEVLRLRQRGEAPPPLVPEKPPATAGSRSRMPTPRSRMKPGKAEDFPSWSGSSSGRKRQSIYWGDREGMVTFRRYLLSPTMVAFGASRRQDSCALWVGELPAMDKEAGSSQPSRGPSRNSPSSAAAASAAKTWSILRSRTLSTGQAEESNASRGPHDAQGDSLPPIGQSASQPGVEVQGSDASRLLRLPSMVEDDGPYEHPDVVCFPPHGVVPLELLADPRAPWSIMPNMSRYQPTNTIRVRMWRIRLHRPQVENWKAERLEEVAVTEHMVDCSTHGNPFCVVFWPQLRDLAHGDAFEVELSGLRGKDSELYFFHEFWDFRLRRRDKGFVAASKRLCDLLGDRSLWQPVESTVSFTDPGGDQSSSTGRFVLQASPGSDHGHGQAHRRSILLPASGQPVNQNHPTLSTAGNTAGANLDLGLVTHPKLSFVSHSLDVVIALEGKNVSALQATLFLKRMNVEEEEVARATYVIRLQDRFIVRVKAPLSGVAYRLGLAASSWTNHGVLVQHPLNYTIVIPLSTPGLLPSLEHPLASKFGHVEVSIAAQVHGITMLAPDSHRVPAGYCYWLAYVDPEMRRKWQGERPAPSYDDTTLFRERLHGVSMHDAAAAAGRRVTSRSGRGVHRDPESAFGVHDFHQAIKTPLEPHCRDVDADVHLDLSVNSGKYIFRMRQRMDFPDFYEALFRLGEDDIGQRVELFVRFPRLQTASYAPQFLARWLVVGNESLPKGF